MLVSNIFGDGNGRCQGRECFAFEVLHHEVVDAVLLADIENGTNVRMIQARKRLCLPARRAFGYRHIRRSNAEPMLGGIMCLVDGD